MLLGRPLRLTRPGLFVTATDTAVGKTVVTCGIAALLRRSTPDRDPHAPLPSDPPTRPVGVCKPLATGCRRDREGLVSEDAEALAHFSDCRLPLHVINPVRFTLPLAPAVAAERADAAIDFDAIRASLEAIDAASRVVLVEGAGGVLVPIDPARPSVTVLDLIAAVGYPVLVVARAGLGTLNHTALTVRALQSVGARLAGLVINGHIADPVTSRTVARIDDPSTADNARWLTLTTGLPVLATVPAVSADELDVARARFSPDVLAALAVTRWWDIVAPARPIG